MFENSHNSDGKKFSMNQMAIKFSILSYLARFMKISSFCHDQDETCKLKATNSLRALFTAKVFCVTKKSHICILAIPNGQMASPARKSKIRCLHMCTYH